MDPQRMHRAASTLSSPQAIALLNALRDSQWHLPSRAASKAKVHVSTATKHLSSLHEAGVLERRRVRTATGHAYAYRLPRPSITLTLDLFPRPESLPAEQARAAVHLFAEVVRRAEGLGGAGVRAAVIASLAAAFPGRLGDDESVAWEARLERLPSPPGIRLAQLVAALRGVRAALDAAVGPLACDRIFRLAFEQAEGVRSISQLPSDLLLGREVAP